jgi:hypothetical protein
MKVVDGTVSLVTYCTEHLLQEMEYDMQTIPMLGKLYGIEYPTFQ